MLIDILCNLFFKQLVFSDVVNNRIYITIDAGENYATRQLGFQPSVLQFSYHDSDRMFIMDNLNNMVR